MNVRSPNKKKLGSSRWLLIDCLRGLAIVLMVVYHFVYDLNYFDFVTVDFDHSEFWISFRSFIVSSFLLLSGISLSLSGRTRLFNRVYLNRLLMVAGSALLVSVVSYQVFPGLGVFFGILHFIAFASIAGPLFLSVGKYNFFIGGLIIVLGVWWQHPVFDNSLLQWVGLVTYLPATVDYVPVFPWLGVYLIGMAVGMVLLEQQQLRVAWFKNWKANTKVFRVIVKAGQHSLLIYMVHQPILIALVAAVYYLL